MNYEIFFLSFNISEFDLESIANNAPFDARILQVSNPSPLEDPVTIIFLFLNDLSKFNLKFFKIF